MIHLKKKGILLFLLTLFLLGSTVGMAQTPINDGNNGRPQDLFNQNDTTNRPDTAKQLSWIDPNVKIYYFTYESDLHRKPDSTLLHFQNIRPRYPRWDLDLGNYGSANRSQFFEAVNATTGPSSGYHIYDRYKLQRDSLRFYNTTNPHSEFSFVLGSKEQQLVKLLHTQNVTPDLNFAINFQANRSDGFFTGQTARNFSLGLSSNYKSKNDRYSLKAGVIYNHFNQDENGGITVDSFLDDSRFRDRRRIPVNFPTVFQGGDHSAIGNELNEFHLFAQNHYAWGSIDTTYNEDSTKRDIHFTPRFSLRYDFDLFSQRHNFHDYQPDSARYGLITPLNFQPRDTLLGKDRWSYISNKFSLNGFVGKAGHLLRVQAGIGNELQMFHNLTPTGFQGANTFNTFLFGGIKKESETANEWHYQAEGKLYLTGMAIGNFSLDASLGKQIKDWAVFRLGFNQSLVSPPSIFQRFSTNFFDFSHNFGKTSYTQLKAGLFIPKANFTVTGGFHLINQYLYFSDPVTFQQASSPISIAQFEARHKLQFAKFILTTAAAYQQTTANSPIHVPALLLQEELAFNGRLFKGVLEAMTGVNVSYTTPYYADGYSPFLNQFYSQNTWRSHNYPRISAFFNFAVHHFRAFVSFDEIQQLLVRNNINAPGYPAENLIFRFGFNWVLVN